MWCQNSWTQYGFIYEFMPLNSRLWIHILIYMKCSSMDLVIWRISWNNGWIPINEFTFIFMKSNSWIKIWYHEFIYLNSYTIYLWISIYTLQRHRTWCHLLPVQTLPLPLVVFASVAPLWCGPPTDLGCCSLTVVVLKLQQTSAWAYSCT